MIADVDFSDRQTERVEHIERRLDDLDRRREQLLQELADVVTAADRGR